MQAPLQTNALGLQVAGRDLLCELTWTVGAGECWCLIGRNGAGKTSLLRTIAGVRDADAGTVTIFGKPLSAWALPELARQRSYLPQTRNDAFGYSVLEVVMAARHAYFDGHFWDGADSDEDRQIALAALRQLDVAELSGRDVRSLSGGERQRVAIAAIIAQDTPLMIVDEPATALDLAHQVSVMHLMAEHCRVRGKAIIMASHDLNMAHHAASHALLLMGDGSWLAGTVDQVMTADKLSECLGHPIECVDHHGQTLFLPKSHI
jgi:iron complex transport system ATP-binding protein